MITSVITIMNYQHYWLDKVAPVCVKKKIIILQVVSNSALLLNLIFEELVSNYPSGLFMSCH